MNINIEGTTAFECYVKYRKKLAELKESHTSDMLFTNPLEHQRLRDKIDLYEERIKIIKTGLFGDIMRQIDEVLDKGDSTGIQIETKHGKVDIPYRRSYKFSERDSL